MPGKNDSLVSVMYLIMEYVIINVPNLLIFKCEFHEIYKGTVSITINSAYITINSEYFCNSSSMEEAWWSIPQSG